MLVINPKVTTQRLKQLSRRAERGNQFWSFKKTDKNLDRYLTYMGKGNEENFCVSRVSSPDKERYAYPRIIQLINAWVSPTVGVRPALKKYLEFENYVKELPIGLRIDEEAIKRLATRYVFNQWGMFNQQANNEISNYVRTYKFKYMG